MRFVELAGRLLSLLAASVFSFPAAANDFPNAGSDAFESTMEVIVSIPSLAIVDEAISLSGPVAVMRGQPGGDPCEIETEIVVMDLVGNHPSFGDVRLRLDPARSSSGKIIASGEGCVFPATSYFDVFVQVEASVLPGEILFNEDPVRVDNDNLTVLPPFFDVYRHPPPSIPLFALSNPSAPFAFIAGESTHRVEQLPTLSVAAGGITLIDPGELHDLGNPPAVGLTLSGLGLSSGDDIDAVSYGLDGFGALEDYESQPIIAFSVDPAAVGSPNSGVNRESINDEAEGDEFLSYYNGTNIEVVDEQAWILQEGTPGDDLDALTNEPTSYADFDGNMTPEQPVFFSLAPGSPSLAGLGADGGALLVSQNGTTSVFAQKEALGLVAGDDVDALCLMKSGLPGTTLRPGTGPIPAAPSPGGARFDAALFSLAPGSPTLTTIGAGPGAILVTDFSAARPNLVGTPPSVYAPASQIGLLAGDNLNALKCLLEVGVFDIWGKPTDDGFWLVDLGGTSEIATWDASYSGQYNMWSAENPGLDFHGPYVHPSSEVAKLVPFPPLDPAQVGFVGGPGDNCGFPHVHGSFEKHTDPDGPACGHGIFVPHFGPEIPIFDCDSLHQIAGTLVNALEQEAPNRPSFAAGYHELTDHAFPPLPASAQAMGVAGGGAPGMAVIVIGMGPFNMDTTLAGAPGLTVSPVRGLLPVPLVVPEPGASAGAIAVLVALSGVRAAQGRRRRDGERAGH